VKRQEHARLFRDWNDLAEKQQEVLAMYAAHFNDTSSYYRMYDGGSGVWGTEQRFNWKLQRPGGSNFQTTYSNLHYLSAENRMYNFVRGNNKSPNIMVSTDMGDTWSYGGQLTRNNGVGYNNGHYRYSENGIDRIEILFTEYHPRDFYTSIYHGYIQGGRSYNSDGALADSSILDTLGIPTPANFTKVFADSTMLAGYLMRRCWNTDVVRYGDGTVVTIVTARTSQYTGADASINPQHAFIYCRYNGTTWTYGYLGKAGPKLYSSEVDYTGNAAVHPNDPNTIFLSTTWDPRDSTVNLGVHEIFKGVTPDRGKTWAWTPITLKSVRDNIRPIVPNWDNDNTALLWWRGTYSSAQIFNAAVVGILDRRLETVGKMVYTDATTANTTFSTGTPLTTTGPDTNSGATDGQWHLRTNVGIWGSLLASSEIGGENAPALKTRLSMPDQGTYDLWVNFWATPSADWRIRAGLSAGGTQLFRQMACKQVDADAHQTALVLAGSGNTFLYQAYVGRVVVAASETVTVFVDDDAIQTGTTGTLIGNTARTWYDGVSYARVQTGSTGVVAESSPAPNTFIVSQNYPNPFNPSTVIQYGLPTAGMTTVKVYNVLGQEVAALVNEIQAPGMYSVRFNASSLSSGVYFFRVQSGSFSAVKRMTLMK
jgi:hypothetical protein